MNRFIVEEEWKQVVAKAFRGEVPKFCCMDEVNQDILKMIRRAYYSGWSHGRHDIAKTVTFCPPTESLERQQNVADELDIFFKNIGNDPDQN